MAKAYKVFRCWVSEYQAMPDLDANANAVAAGQIVETPQGFARIGKDNTVYYSYIDSLQEAQKVLVSQRSATLLTIARDGVSGVVQRTGEVQVLQDGFDALDAARWSRTGTPEIKGEKKRSGTGALVRGVQPDDIKKLKSLELSGGVGWPS